jgi:hypothetical protein
VYLHIGEIVAEASLHEPAGPTVERPTGPRQHGLHDGGDRAVLAAASHHLPLQTFASALLTTHHRHPARLRRHTCAGGHATAWVASSRRRLCSVEPWRRAREWASGTTLG